MAASILLLFPGGASKYLLEGHISSHAKAVPGVWGGIAVSTAGSPSFLLGLEQGLRVQQGTWLPFVPQLWFCPCRCCWQRPTSRHWGGTRAGTPNKAVGGIWPCPTSSPTAPGRVRTDSPSPLALLGAAACFVLSGVGLTNGPLCFYNTTELGLRHGLLPFLSLRADNYLYNQRTWSICLEPEGIVSWHVVLFSLLLLISVAEMVLALLQILNGFLGCFCGFCEGK
uniref:Transmembrane 4 L6 family member 19 n=1 Tax=Catharus ustulatus TaxID=91951 RepID=A0A8C3UBF8_CATUS